MRVMPCLVCVVWLAVIGTLRPIFAADPSPVTIEPMLEVYPAGVAVPVRVVYLSWHAGLLQMNPWNVPNVVRLSVVDAAGKTVPMNSPIGGEPGHGSRGPPVPIPTDQLYKLQPGEMVEFGVDLTTVYQLARVGRYTLQFGAPKPFAEVRFDIGEPKVVEERRVDGGWLPAFGADPVEKGQAASGAVRLVDVAHGKGHMRFMVLEDISVTGEEHFHPRRAAHPVPADSSIAGAEMDFMGQVWVIIKSGRQSELVLMRPSDMEAITLIPFTETPIEMGSTPAWSNPRRQNLVIAGKRGAVKHTSRTWRRYVKPAADETDQAKAPE